jgi:hypothetical protein
MNYKQFFADLYFTEEDIVNFAALIKLLYEELGMGRCWCVKRYNTLLFNQFRVTHKYRPLYKNKDPRLMALALANRFAPVEEGRHIVLVRRHTCTSQYCINPDHYYFGTAKDVKLEQAKRQGKKISPEILTEIRTRRESNKTKWTYEKLGKFFKLPYHVVRRICLEGAYTNDL